nr:hypothetical protein [Alteribacter salitolerans]
MSIPEGTVKSRIYTAVQSLKCTLEGEENEERKRG